MKFFLILCLLFSTFFCLFYSSAELKRDTQLEITTKKNKIDNHWKKLKLKKDTAFTKWRKTENEYIKAKDKKDNAFNEWIKANDKNERKVYIKWAKADDKWGKIKAEKEKAFDEFNRISNESKRRFLATLKPSPEYRKAQIEYEKAKRSLSKEAREAIDRPKKLITSLERAMHKKNKAASERDRIFAELKRTIPEFRRAVAERDKAKYKVDKTLFPEVKKRESQLNRDPFISKVREATSIYKKAENKVKRIGGKRWEIALANYKKADEEFKVIKDLVKKLTIENNKLMNQINQERR